MAATALPPTPTAEEWCILDDDRAELETILRDPDFRGELLEHSVSLSDTRLTCRTS